MIKDGDNNSDRPFIVGLIASVILWALVENATYNEGKPIDISPAKVSILHDNEVCIIRYGDDYQETFEDKSDYDNIIDSNFVLQKIPLYDILGEDNGCDYEIKIND
jgi:hypothetical protein